MGYNKLILNGITKFDITQDTVSSKVMLQGYTAHDHSGSLVTGVIPTQDGSSINRNEETENVIIPAGYYPKGIVLWYNEYGQWEWDPFDFENGVVIQPSVIRYDGPQTTITLNPNVFHDLSGVDTTSLKISLNPLPEDNKAARYHLCFRTGKSGANIVLPENIFLPSGYSIEPNTVYKFDIIENLLNVRTYQVPSTEIVLVENSSSSSLTEQIPVKIENGTNLVLFVDYVSDTSNSYPIIYVGTSLTGVAAYMANQGIYSQLHFDVFGQSQNLTYSGIDGHHKMILKINFSYNYATVNSWMDRERLLTEYEADISDATYEIFGSDWFITNMYQSLNFNGTYNKISIITKDMTDEELLQLSALEEA